MSGDLFEVTQLANGKYTFTNRSSAAGRKRNEKMLMKQRKSALKTLRLDKELSHLEPNSDDSDYCVSVDCSDPEDCLPCGDAAIPPIKTRDVKSVALLEKPCFLRNEVMQGTAGPGPLSLTEAKTIATQILKGAKRNHIHKTAEQEELLFNEWLTDPMFTKKRLVAVARNIGLSESQVYKWVWDRNRGKGAVMQMAKKLMNKAVPEPEM